MGVVHLGAASVIDSRFPELDIGVRVLRVLDGKPGTRLGRVIRYAMGAGRPWVVHWDDMPGVVGGGTIDWHLGDEIVAAPSN
jgi:predicted metallo-beta-lactamase superfamily hydrolase